MSSRSPVQMMTSYVAVDVRCIPSRFINWMFQLFVICICLYVCDPDTMDNRLMLCFIIKIKWNDQLLDWLEPLILQCNLPTWYTTATTVLYKTFCCCCFSSICTFYSCSCSTHFNPVINRKFDLSAIEHMAIKQKKNTERHCRGKKNTVAVGIEAIK